jgi:hypothetical protein
MRRRLGGVTFISADDSMGAFDPLIIIAVAHTKLASHILVERPDLAAD